MPVVWNDLIREVERIRRRKNQSPLSASWHRNVGIALKQCPFELAEATPEAIREWIDQMQDSGLSGLTLISHGFPLDPGHCDSEAVNHF